jgi:hypothetical protein
MFAWYSTATNDGHALHRRVIAFDDDGRPLALDASLGERPRLVPADSLSGYIGIFGGSNETIVAVLPADGWVGVDVSGRSPVPLVGWGLQADGEYRLSHLSSAER